MVFSVSSGSWGKTELLEKERQQQENNANNFFNSSHIFKNLDLCCTFSFIDLIADICHTDWKNELVFW